MRGKRKGTKWFVLEANCYQSEQTKVTMADIARGGDNFREQAVIRDSKYKNAPLPSKAQTVTERTNSIAAHRSI